MLLQYFGCGRIVENRHRDDYRSSSLRFSVKRRRELVEIVVPFFEEDPLRAAKQLDFEQWARILRLMQGGAHLTEPGLAGIAREPEQMTRRSRSRYLESSEAIRQPTHTDCESKRWS